MMLLLFLMFKSDDVCRRGVFFTNDLNVSKDLVVFSLQRISLLFFNNILNTFVTEFAFCLLITKTKGFL